MVTIKVKDGTPQGAETLCTTCRWAHIVKGFRASEKEILCRYLTDDRPVRFSVSQCNSYDDRRIPGKRDMEQIAWILLTKKAGRTIGFVTAKRFLETARLPDGVTFYLRSFFVLLFFSAMAGALGFTSDLKPGSYFMEYVGK